MTDNITVDGPSPMAVVFGEAKDQQSLLQCRKLTAAAFGAPFSEQDYLEREEYLDQQPLTRDGGWRTWCLRTTTEPLSQAVASCKTIRRDLLVREANIVAEKKGYCIVNVVTHPDFRGRGLASELLQHLGRWLDGPGEATASMLYTSIGNFYHDRGWKMLPAYQVEISCPTPEHVLPSARTLSATRTLTGAEIHALCGRDMEGIRASFQTLEDNEDEIHLSVLPTPDITAWMQAQGDFTASEMFDRKPTHHGSVCETTESWLYWYHDYRKQHLAVQRIHLGESSNRLQLVQALTAMLFDAVKEARGWNLATVVVWDPSDVVLEAANALWDTHGIGVNHGPRVGASMPSIRWRGADLSRKIIVHNNEKFAYS
ncbi:hypothetical protein PG995_016240 [Apiospora arundinis]